MIRSVEKVNVYFRDTLVGTIQMAPVGSQCVFEYDKTWLAEGFSLSPTELPLSGDLMYADPGKFRGNFAIFEDSLPDGYGLYLLDRILRGQGTSLEETTPLQRLSLIGRSGMGALNYRPVIPTTYGQDAFSMDDLDLVQRKALDVLSEKDITDASLLYYNSANSGGARPKIALIDDEGAHWIVKFRHLTDPGDIGANEYLYMQTASKCGIHIPRVRLFGGKYFASERFDIGEDGERIHMASAAALLKVDFRQQNVDYTNLLALTGYLTQDPEQVEEMFRRMVFNLIAENKDDHGKNFTFLCDGSSWRLAPAYDLTYSPAGSNGEHATSLFFNGNPGIDLVIKAGTGIRIPKARCLEIIATIQSICKDNLPRIKELI
ncbi:MAG: type II toxin-antitoxin system HipA family toxin [Bacteroidales bacterium]|nr:type II toxin-antitoxin system HipA family toxin [Bacteroidales bacterium]